MKTFYSRSIYLGAVFCMLLPFAAQADGLNSSGGRLPMGAGNYTLMSLDAPTVASNGMVNFYAPGTTTKTGWIDTTSGTASFVNSTISGTSTSNTVNTTTLNSTTVNSAVTNATTNITVGGSVANSTTINTANNLTVVIASCAAAGGGTLHVDAKGNLGCIKDVAMVAGTTSTPRTDGFEVDTKGTDPAGDPGT